ncbi:HDOD domain-containing protein [Pleionea sp. CnH1-48]|uniref:HDOD domain-containing protein n=1 Tax=Pleionea sp. CnH1-48 TaxID=2954494 RepID=UPI0020969918|nr:HDOD domain-containing protein [Pleionea sp. CnH1-48]MCO7224192.1 HDOD domain-containing protein [Pleionea sp. CnH1-48]
MTSPTPVAEDAFENVQIPPRPQTLEQIAKETKEEYPNIANIAKAIGEDVGLSAAVLQVINSPGFYLSNKITNIQQAVNLLGVKRVERIVTMVSMKSSIGGNLNLDKFWDDAADIATLASALSGKMGGGVDRDDAYTLGLFQNCGIPLMMQAFDDYKDTMKEMEATDVYPVNKIERDRYKFSHVDVGYRLLKRWFLPEYLCEAVYYGYLYFDELIENNDVASETLALIAIMKVSHDIKDTAKGSGEYSESVEWERIKPHILSYMSIDEHDYAELKEEMIEELANG